MNRKLVDYELKKYKITIPSVYKSVDKLISLKGNNWDNSMCPKIENLTKLFIVEYIDSINKASHGAITTKKLLSSFDKIDKIKYNDDFVKRAKCLKDDDGKKIALFRKLFFDKVSSEIEKMNLINEDEKTKEFQKYMQKDFCMFSSRLAIRYLDKNKQDFIECEDSSLFSVLIGKNRGYGKTLKDFLVCPNKLIDELSQIKVKDRDLIECFNFIKENNIKINNTIDQNFECIDSENIKDYFYFNYYRDQENDNQKRVNSIFPKFSEEKKEVLKTLITEKDISFDTKEDLKREVNCYYKRDISKIEL